MKTLDWGAMKTLDWSAMKLAREWNVFVVIAFTI